MRNALSLSALLVLTTLSVFAQKDMKAIIMAQNEKFMDTFAKNVANMSSHYTSDATLMPPGSEPIRGNTAIGGYWKGGQDAGVKRAKLETIEAEMAGSQVIEAGRYTLYGANDAQLDAGKYIVMWKQEGGQWKLHRDIWNTNTPPAMAAK